MVNSDILYITGAGVSTESGIPTYRGNDGYWTVGSRNYTPQQMATHEMYQTNPLEFLRWCYRQVAIYRHNEPNDVHYWLANKNLITQNVDGLDTKAGNQNYISIHGQLNKVTLYLSEDKQTDIIDAPWDDVDESNLDESLLDLFRISKEGPIVGQSYKPLVLLFDEEYTDLYGISKAEHHMCTCSKMIFMGTSFSVGITQLALMIASDRNIPIEVVDPDPQELIYDNIIYHRMTAKQYIMTLE